MLYQLSYFRRFFLWAKMDSNHRRYKPADLQSAPFGHSGIRPYNLSASRSLTATTVPFRDYYCFRASCRIRTNDPEITNHVLWPTELKRRLCQKISSFQYFSRSFQGVSFQKRCKITTIFLFHQIFCKKISQPPVFNPFTLHLHINICWHYHPASYSIY